MSERITLFGLNLKPLIDFIQKYSIFLSLILLLFLTYQLFSPTLTLNQFEPELRDFYQNNKNQTYLYEYDPYYYLLQAENSKSLDSYHVNFILAFHNFFHFDNLTQSMFYYSFFLIFILIILAFLILRNITSTTCALLGTIFFLTLLVNSGRIYVGFVDTDIYNILFPIIIFFLIYHSFKSDSYYNYLFLILSSLMISIYSRIWHGWWFFFHLSWLCFLLISLFTKEWKKLFPFFLYFFSSLISIVIFNDLNTLKQIFISPLPLGYASILGEFNFIFIVIFFLILIIGFYFVYKYLKPKLNPKLKKVFLFLFILLLLIFPLIFIIFYPTPFSILPDSFKFVSELQSITYFNLLLTLGGVLLFFLSYIGYLIYAFKKEFSLGDRFLLLLALFWFSLSIIATLLAIRFMVLILFPLALGFTLFLFSISNYILKIESFQMDKEIILNFLILPLFIFLLFFPWIDARSNIVLYHPEINDNWISALDYLKENTPENSFVSTWWDYGYFIQALSKREVIFTGGSQNTPAAYWIGKAFSTDNENLSKNIFNLFACTKDPYLNQIKSILAYTPQNILILEQILSVDELTAQKLLISKTKLNLTNINLLVQLTHCKPKSENYVLVDGRMLYFDAIYKLGHWNFTKAQSCAELKKVISNFNCEEFMFENLTYSIPYKCTNITESYYKCGILHFQLEKDNSLLNATIIKKEEMKIPKSLFYLKNGILIEKNFNNSSFNDTIYLIQRNNTYYAYTSPPQLSSTLLTKLYFYNGIGLNNFEKIYETEWQYNKNILIYKLK